MHEILSKIRTSFDLLELSDDWDGDDADKAIPEAFNKAMLFIHLVIAKHGLEIPIPDIGLMRDGCTYIEFKKMEYSFLIVFNRDCTSCYGDNGNNEDVIKSSGDDLQTESILLWLKQHIF